MRRRIDPEARQALLAIAGGRIAIGVGALAATRPALAAFGFAAPGPQATALARVAGSRDVALGLLTLAARDDRSWLRTVGLAAAGVDAADAAVFGIAARQPELRLAGAGGGLSGAAAALVGVWAVGRLSARGRVGTPRWRR